MFARGECEYEVLGYSSTQSPIFRLAQSFPSARNRTVRHPRQEIIELEYAAQLFVYRDWDASAAKKGLRVYLTELQ